MYFEKIQQTKLITTYGAIGSIIETLRNGAMRILEFDQWPYYQHLLLEYSTQDGLNIPNNLIINDDRLLYRIRTDMGLPQLEHLFKLPENVTGFNGQLLYPNHVISADMFPKWYICPACQTENMRHETGVIVPHNPRYPQCPNHENIRLEQFPFVLISATGKICDIPWTRFLNAPADADKIEFEPNNPRDYQGVFTYSSGGSAEILATKSIRINNNSRSLARIGSIDFVSGDDTYKVVSRFGNNICFIEKMTSVSIDDNDIYLKPNIRVSLNNIHDTLKDVFPQFTMDQVLSSFRNIYPNTHISLDQVSYHFKIRNDNQVTEDTKYKSEEYAFFLNHEQYDNRDTKFCKYKSEITLFSSYVMIERLKIVHAQTSYSRLTPEGTKKPICINQNVRLYPAIEMYGEGVFLFFDLNKLNKYKNDNNLDPSSLFPIIHTSAHSIVRELEFYTGYPVNSMCERLYFRVNNENEIIEAGALIYSASTSEGSYGGMKTLFSREIDGRNSFSAVLQNAMDKANECSNDPICENETLSNGSSGVCYACNILPEITCEMMNSNLDRNSMLSYFNHIGTLV
jgi:hypothetical protein